MIYFFKLPVNRYLPINIGGKIGQPTVKRTSCFINTTFNNISDISWRSCSLIGGGNWSTLRKPSTCPKSLTNFIT